MRLRISRSFCPGPALILTDTPRPDCRSCGGDGGVRHDYGDPETGEYAGSHWEHCPCWDNRRAWTLLPLPHVRLLRHRISPGYSSEPPF